MTFAILFGIIGGVMVRQRTLAARDVKRLDPAETLQDGCFLTWRIIQTLYMPSLVGSA